MGICPVISGRPDSTGAAVPLMGDSNAGRLEESGYAGREDLFIWWKPWQQGLHRKGCIHTHGTGAQLCPQGGRIEHY